MKTKPKKRRTAACRPRPAVTGLTPEMAKNFRAFIRLAETETPLLSERIAKGRSIAMRLISKGGRK